MVLLQPFLTRLGRVVLALNHPIGDFSRGRRIELEVINDARFEPSLAGIEPGERVQLERLGYFCADPDSTPARPVFNRTVTLRDTWAKVKARG